MQVRHAKSRQPGSLTVRPGLASPRGARADVAGRRIGRVDFSVGGRFCIAPRDATSDPAQPALRTRTRQSWGDPVVVDWSEQMARLVLGLLRPYRGWLAVVFAAMLLEIVASLAAPWPLKLVLDDALGRHRLPEWLAWAH